MEVFRIHKDVPIYYFTFSVVHWLPLFISAESCLIVTESLNYCHEQKGLRTNAFVIMPTHMHLVGFDADFDAQRLSQTVAAMRQYTGRRLADFCEQKMPGVFGQVIRGTRRTDRERQLWQQSRHPEAIYSHRFWKTKVGYLHDNPRRKGLVHDATHWRFSSAAYWLLDPPGETDVILTAIEW
jgi:putative transposase